MTTYRYTRPAATITHEPQVDPRALQPWERLQADRDYAQLEHRPSDRTRLLLAVVREQSLDPVRVLRLGFAHASAA